MIRMLTRSVKIDSFTFDRELEVLDTQQLLRRCEQSIQLASGLIDEFLHQTSDDLSGLQRALAAGDVARIASMAYRIAGAAEAVGAEQTAHIARAIQTSCCKGAYDSLPLQVWQLENNTAELSDAASRMGA